MSAQTYSRAPAASADAWAVSIRRDGRAASLLWAALFSACLIYVYISWLAPNYYYMGFPLTPGSRSVLWFALALVLMSASVLPLRLMRFSDFFLWMLFYFVYTPSMLFVPLQGLLADDGLVFVSALTLSFHLMRAISRYQFRLPAVVIDRRMLIQTLFLAYFLLNACVFSVYGGSLKLVSFEDVYDQRSAASDLATGSLVGYASGLLAGAFNPFFMAVGLVERRKWWLLVGIVGQVFLYTTAAMKFVLLSGLLAPVFYYFLIRKNRISSARLGVLVAASCIAPLMLLPILSEAVEGVAWQITSLIFMRTYGMAGALTGVYADFFSDHPHTYFSHINVVSMFVPYPYELSVGEEVGSFLVGSPLDANANFWATDGIAAAGTAGVVLMGVIVGGFLMMANSIVATHSRRLAFVGFLPFIITISNSSLFTCLLTGGGGVLLAMVYFWQSAAHCKQTEQTVAARP